MRYRITKRGWRISEDISFLQPAAGQKNKAAEIVLCGPIWIGIAN
ncbi:MAG: hypothetical protein ONB27_09385 [candidate division KSB1 bacterium]|nr:hypothetical protein [candidate division KSB1 bacterium]